MFAKRALLFAALFVWCELLLGVRVLRSHQVYFDFLIWNLLLAAVPAVAAAILHRIATRGASLVTQLPLFVVWLLFLPNAPYLTTDFIHLSPRPPVPLWYDVVLIGSSAATGLLLGYTSVADVQDLVMRRAGRVAGWVVACSSLLLAGLGVYIGRFLRWNSWDAISRPLAVSRRLAHPGLHPFEHERGIAVTMIYGAGLVLGYLALHVIATAFRREHPRPRMG